MLILLGNQHFFNYKIKNRVDIIQRGFGFYRLSI